MRKFFMVIFLSIIPVVPFLSKDTVVFTHKTKVLERTGVGPKIPHYQIQKESVIEFIKEHEGFRSRPYYCIGGSRTIGHGLVTKYIDKQFRDGITEQQSDSIIRVKIDRYILRAKKKYPGLNPYQYLTISHLFYCKGEGGIRNHPIHYQIKNGYINKNTLLYYSKYEETRAHYRKTRRFEWKLWNF